MSTLALALQGLLIGLAVAMPVGPMTLFCVQQTLRSGRLAGLASGLGIASADAIYAGMAVVGLAAVQEFLIGHRRGFALLSGLILLALAARIASREMPAEPAPLRPRGLAAAFAATLGLTLTNPMTILSFIAIFAGLGIRAGDGSLIQGAVLVVSVLLGSALWWLVLVELVNRSRRWIGRATLLWLNRAGGVAIAGFGVLALIRAF